MNFNFGLGLEKDIIKKEEKSGETPKTSEGFVRPADIRGGAVHQENKYNNPDEGFRKQEKTFVPIEEVADPDSGEEQFINKLSDKLEKEMEINEDKYDFIPLINGLVKTAQEKGEKELDDVITKAAQFVSQYKEILESGLSDERNEKKESEGKEYEVCQKAFKDIFGDIVYIDGKLEMMPRTGFIKLKEPKVNKDGYIELGNKIYYDKTGRIGYLSEKEAREAKAINWNKYKKVNEKV